MENNLKISDMEGDVINIYLSPAKTPDAYERKVCCLMSGGFSREEAEQFIRTSPLCMELFYDIGRGLFAVESEAVTNAPIYNPYTGIEIPQEEENENLTDEP